MPETIYNNRYRLDAKVGEGGMAVVYRGYDLLLRRQVAVKVLRPQFSADDAFVHRFSQEAQAAARLSHPNIVNTYDVGDAGDAHFIVQEYVSGETLASLIAREKRIPEAAAIRYGMQICAALSAAHRGELLHRDIKPSNILITGDDVVRVADFGIARAVNAQTATSTDDVLASVPYGAPEHLTGQQLCEASDLYSVGVVLFEMVTGKRPYDAETAMGVAMAHVNAPVPDPVEAGAQIGPKLRDVIMRLLAKSAKERYQSAGEVLAELRRCLDTEALAGRNGETLTVDRESDTAVIRKKKEDARRRWFAGLDERAPATWDPRRLVAIASAIVIAILLVVIVGGAIRDLTAGGLRVPAVAGKTVADAVAALHAADVDGVRIVPRVDAAVPAGTVDGSDPAAGARIAPSSTLMLFVSAGPATQSLASVVGMSVKAATTLLTGKGFTVRVGTTVHSDSVTKGLVAKTNPAPGAKVAAASTIVLLPSGGPNVVTVPNVVDLSEADARTALTRAGLVFQIGQRLPNVNIAPNTVMDQVPSGGSTAPPGSVVTVDESGGPASLTVPDVVGGTQNDAKNTLAQAGLVLGQVNDVEDPSTTPGTVVSQNPLAGSQASEGSPVDIYLAVAAASPSPAGASLAPSASPLGPVPNVIGMSIDDAKAALLRAGFTANNVTVAPGSPPDAKVIATQPAPGATVAPGTTEVDLTVGPGHP